MPKFFFYYRLKIWTHVSFKRLEQLPKNVGGKPKKRLKHLTASQESGIDPSKGFFKQNGDNKHMRC